MHALGRQRRRRRIPGPSAFSCAARVAARGVAALAAPRRRLRWITRRPVRPVAVPPPAAANEGGGGVPGHVGGCGTVDPPLVLLCSPRIPPEAALSSRAGELFQVPCTWTPGPECAGRYRSC